MDFQVLASQIVDLAKKDVTMSITVSKSVYSMMKRDLEAKRKKVAKAQDELKALEATFKSVKVVTLRKRK